MAGSHSWVFFAGGAKPTSMRKAVGMRMAESEPVVVVEQPVSVLRDRRLPPFSDRQVSIPGAAGSFLYRPLHLPQELPGCRTLMARANRQRLFRELRQMLPPAGSLVVCYDSPHQHSLVQGLREDIAVYLAIDDRTLTVGGEPILGELEAEKQLLSRVDLVVCVSDTLAAVLKSRTPPERNIPIHVLTNGYDERIFDPQRQTEEPEILVRVPRPRVLVAGHISERIDWVGIVGALSERPEWSWILVGSVDDGIKERVTALAAHSSGAGAKLTVAAPVEIEDVPALIQHCDACAVPYRLNAFSLGSSPLKAVEYLAMGAPVLSTRIPSLESYGDAIHWVEPGVGATYANALDAIKSEGRRCEFAAARRAAVGGQSLASKAETFRRTVLQLASV